VSRDRSRKLSTGVAQAKGAPPQFAPGKRTLTEAIPPSVGADATPAAGGGSALPGEVRGKMEAAFTTDFSAVRVHHDAAAAGIGARAFTSGANIHFAPGELAPDTHAGQALIGHELAHVVQQAEGRVAAPAQAKGVALNADPALETEADHLGERAARGEVVRSGPVAVGATAAAVQAKTITVLNFDRLADQIHKAVDGLGTDEEAVYSALTALEHDASNIAALEAAYKKHGDLRADLDDDFSGSELAYVKSLLTPAAGAGDAKGAAAAPKEPDYAKLAKQIHDAVDGLGTDEEAVYTALSSLEHDPAKIAKLEEAYKTAYSATLREDLLDDFSGSELKHVLELLGDRSTNEKVNVANDDEAKRAAEIIREIFTKYGIDVNSQAGVDAIDRDYSEVPREVRDKLRTKAWEFKELVALKAALDRYAPLLGDARKDSARAGTPQEIRTVSKVDHGIDVNSASGVLDNTTMGEFFETSNNFSMFTHGTDFAGAPSVGVFKDNATNLEANAVHEMGHAVFRSAEPDFIKQMDYWTDESTKSGKAGAEEPVTPYGQTNAREDLAEAVKFFFIDPATLLSKCPKRHAFVKKTIDAWTPPKPAKK
jgi:hypothetical protein